MGCGQCGYRSSTLREVNLDSLRDIIVELLVGAGAGEGPLVLSDIHGVAEGDLTGLLAKFVFACNDEATGLLAALRSMDGQRIWSLSEAQIRREFGQYLPCRGTGFDEIVKRAAANALLSAMQLGHSIRLFEQNQELKSETEAYASLLNAINATALLSIARGEFKLEQWEAANEKARLELVRRAFDE